MFNNPIDKHAMKIVKGDETVIHWPRKFCRIAWYFLGRRINVEVICRRWHCKQLCGGMEVPCQLQFNCSNKEHVKRLKELLNLYLLKFSVQFVKRTSQFTLSWINGLVYKLHPRFLTQNLSKKGAAYTQVFMVCELWTYKWNKGSSSVGRALQR